MPPESRWLLAVQEPSLFAAALIALWKKRAIPVISADLQPGTLLELEQHADGVVHDEPVHTLKPSIRVTTEEGDVDTGTDPAMSFNGEDTALELFTSGTTGERKLISKKFRSLFEETDNLERAFGPRVAGLPRFTTVSHFHIYGLLFNILWPLRAGDSFPPVKSFYWEEILDRATGPCCISSSPAHLRFLADVAASRRFHKEGTVLFSSGGPLDGAVARAIEDTGLAAPVEVFGSTETGGAAWRCQGRQGDDAFTPFAPVEVRCDAHQHLQLRSPWLDDPDAWTDVGDRAAIEDGRFRLLGRADRIAKIAGKRVSLLEMENLLRTDARILDVRVFQMTGDRRADRSALAVVAVLSDESATRDNARPTLIQELRRLLLARFEPVTLPRRWRFVASLPVDTQGKTTIALLSELFHG